MIVILDIKLNRKICCTYFQFLFQKQILFTYNLVKLKNFRRKWVQKNATPYVNQISNPYLFFKFGHVILLIQIILTIWYVVLWIVIRGTCCFFSTVNLKKWLKTFKRLPRFPKPLFMWTDVLETIQTLRSTVQIYYLFKYIQ